MDEFRGRPLEGEWWTADERDRRYKGTLIIDEDDHGKLTLRGTESQLASLPHDAKRRTFSGQIKSPYTYDLSLFNVGMERGPARSHPKVGDPDASAELYTNNVLIGGHVDSEDDAFVNGALLHLTGLEEWCDSTAFSGTFKRENEAGTEVVDVSFRGHATPHYDVGSGRLLRFLSEYRGPYTFDHRKSVTLTERNTIELVFAEAISITQLLSDVTIWQLFITLGLRRPSYIDEILPLVHSGGEKFTRMGLIVPGRRPDVAARRVRPRDALFNQSKLDNNIGLYLKNWRERQEHIETAALLFGGAAYQESTYVHADLLTYLQALEVLHRESFDIDRFPDAKTRKATISALRSAVPSSLSEILQAEIKEQLGYIGTLTLLDRLKHLFSLYPKSLGPLFPRGDADMALLKDARNFLTHYGEKLSFNKEFLWSRTVYVLKEKARLFLEVCLLGTLGMTDDEIVELINDFEPYREWRAEIKMEAINEMLRSAKES